MMFGACFLLFILTAVEFVPPIMAVEMAELLPVLVPAPGFYLTPRPAAGEPLITLEFFLDLNCGASRDAWGPALELSQHYSAEDLAIRIYMYPLPYHRNAMLCSQGLFLMQQRMPDKAQDYISMVFAHGMEFTTKATANQTEHQVLELLADYTEQLTGLPQAEFLAEIQDYNRAVRKEWKLGASRGVAGTPTVFVNGIEVYFYEVTFQGLQSMLDRLLGKAEPASSTNTASSSSATSIYTFW